MSTHSIYFDAICCPMATLWCNSWGGSFIFSFQKIYQKVELGPVDLEKIFFGI